LVVPNAVRNSGAKTSAVVRFDHWVPLRCGSNLARSNEPLLRLPYKQGDAGRHVDQIHLDQFTAVCVPVHHLSPTPFISRSGSLESDYEYLEKKASDFGRLDDRTMSSPLSE